MMLKPDHVQNTLSSSTLCKVIPPPLTDVEHRYMYSPVSVVVSGDNAVDSGVLGLGPLWNHWTRNLPLAPITIHLPARRGTGSFRSFGIPRVSVIPCPVVMGYMTDEVLPSKKKLDSAEKWPCRSSAARPVTETLASTVTFGV